MKKYLPYIIIFTSALGVLIEMVLVGINESFISGLSILKYFTIQSNILVSVYFVLVVFKIDNKVKHYVGGITLYNISRKLLLQGYTVYVVSGG